MATAAAAVLAVVGVTAIGFAVLDQEPAPPQPEKLAAAAPSDPASRLEASATESDDAPRTGPEQGEAAEVRSLDYSEPVRIEIPKIDVSSSLVDLGLDSEGVMETPEPVDQAGWFTPSPPPGVPGATVIAGHVTWNQQPSVFFELGDLGKGDRVRVERADGVVTTFRVTRIGSFPKEAFPTEAVYTQPPRSELRLITCGGEYDASTNRYLDNVIVWAKIVDTSKSPA